MTTETRPTLEPQRPPWISKELWEDMRTFSILSELDIRLRVAEMVGEMDRRMMGDDHDN